MSDPMTQKAQDAAEAMRDAAQAVTEEARGAAKQTARSVRSTAEKAARSARKTTAAVGEKVAEVLHDGAERGEAAGHRLVESVAGGIENLSGQLREGNIGQIVAEAEGFARRNPLLFIAGAALAGFAIARMTAPRGRRDEGL